MNSNFKCFRVANSVCPICNQKVHLLADGLGDLRSLPSFYICFACKFIGQVGVGPVEVMEVQRKEVINDAL